MKKMRGSIGGRDEGFTLIELMIVVLIIAILIAIAIPTFLGARERAQDRAAQSSLRNALTAENVYYTDSQWFTGDAATLGGIETALQWVAASDNQNQVVALVCGNAPLVAVNPPEGDAVTLSVLSAHSHGFSANDVKVDSAGFTGNSYTVDAGAARPWGGTACSAAAIGPTDSSQGWRH